MTIRRLVTTLIGVLGLDLVLAVSALAQGAEKGYRIFRPEGAGPHPAVAFVSGCSGFTPSFAPKSYERPAEQLQAQGFVVLFVDYLGRRELESCAKGKLAHADVANDLVFATLWLTSQPSVDPARISAIGWSYGGGALLLALADRAELGISRAVVFYPDCRPVKPWKRPTPTLVLLAGDDDVAPGKACQAVVKKNAVPDAVKIVVYPGARHGFDVAELPPKMRYPFGTIGHDPRAAAAAWEEVQQFLKSP